MNIALLGYGKMGRIIEKIATDRKHEVILKIDFYNQQDLTIENLAKADVVIEFSTPGSVLSNIMHCFEAGVPVIVGTTGWYENLPEIKRECLQGNHSMLYASNLSIGVNIFFHINKILARLMNNYPYYDVQVEEIHHTQKLDAPSGNAISLAKDIFREIKRKDHWQLNGMESESTLKINAIRRDPVPGIHTIKYDSAVDDIEMTHNAKSRKGFALGAVLAAEFIKGKKGVFSMDDLLKF